MKSTAILLLFSALILTTPDLSSREHKRNKKTEVQRNKHKNSEDLGGNYSKDSWDVYYKGEVIEDASALSFVYLKGGYAKDSWKVFYKGRVVKDASTLSFQNLGDGYAKDNWNSFYKGKKIR